MNKEKKTSKNQFIELEEKILKFWQEKKIFEKLRAKIAGKKPWSFIDGPITANNPMGVHHAWGRTFKDFFQRYKAMRGFDERFESIFDCQGLWVEVEVEKDLGFNSKKDIEGFGLDKFSRACRARVEKFSKIQIEQSIRLGQWMDWDHSYFTMSDENNYYIWHFLKTCWQKGWLYKGHFSIPWCPRCGTAISAHELSEGGYKEIEHDTVYLRIPLVNKTNEYLTVWTTTPWTLAANVAVAVNPDLNYLKVKKDKAFYYISEKTAKALSDFKIIEIIKGKKMVGWKYLGIFDELPAAKGVEHKIIPWKDVGEEEGTGLVHIAPGCGAEDFELGKKFDLAVLAPLDEAGNYVAGYGFLTGKNAADVREDVYKSLKEKDLFIKTEKILHRYPICWRCKEELVFRVTDEWYIKADPIRPLMKKAAKKVNWLPEYAGKRMQDWLDNMGDWPISRKRYWGLALPFYECSCGELVVVGSKEELKKLAVDPAKVDQLPEPHRPWIDEIKIKCPKCGKEVSRIKDVGDCWLDAGILPFSTLKYFNDKKYWQKWFPADFVTESLPQVKLWFYSTLFMAVTLENSPPYENVLTYMTVLDEKGKPMHKSAGNAIWFDEAVEKMGADVMRWLYLMGAVDKNLLFGFNLADETRKKLLILWNVYTFYLLFAGQKSKGEAVKVDNFLDKWILSKLNILVKETTQILDTYYPTEATEKIQNFFISDLSTWYLRRSRERIKGNDEHDKQSAIQTLETVLLTLVKLLAPFIPFLTEEMYKNLGGQLESVHLEDWPKPNESMIHPKVIEAMDFCIKVAEIGHSLRAEAGIKLRQPLADVQIVTNKRLSTDQLVLIKEELNVKDIGLPTDFKETKNYLMKSSDGLIVALNIAISEELAQEGMKQEIIRQTNQLRKDQKLTLKDKIETQYLTNDKELQTVIKKFEQEIKAETIAQKLAVTDLPKEAKEGLIQINGKKLLIKINLT